SREVDRNRMNLYRAGPKSDLSSAPSFTFYPTRAARNATTYAKTALWLNTLERRLGWPILQRIMSTYFERWRFKHPLPEAFFQIANEGAGENLDPFFDEVYRSSNAFDYGVQELTSVKHDAAFETSVIVRRYGEGIFPVDVRVTFTDGSQASEHWDGRDRWKLYQLERP